jgi:tyrosyl-DNA phosphodiesterase-1
MDGSCSVDFVCRNPSETPKSAANPLSQKIPFGVHHSKIFFVGYSTGALRVIIHTANLRYSDIHQKAQAAYVQDFPRKTATSPSTCQFEKDLISYMTTYHYNKKYKWDDTYSNDNDNDNDNDTASGAITIVEQLKKYDFSGALAILVPSTPGYHKLSDEQPLGHLKLRKAISEVVAPATNHRSNGQDTTGPVVCQFSSIGSLTKKYLHKIEASLDATKANTATNPQIDEHKSLNLQLVYPTSDEICNSLEGYRGGGSVPGSHKNVSKDFLQPLFCKWSAPQSFLASLTASHTSTSNGTGNSTGNSASNGNNPLWKGNNVPHIKTYFQLTSKSGQDDPSMLWFCLGSHNLSKAAFGDDVQSKVYGGTRFFVRHWELGVFLAPSMLNAQRLVPCSPGGPTNPGPEDVTIPLPYRPRPIPYVASDKPWAVDQRYVRLDIFGRRGATDP